jgi:hypothetical protein
MLMPLADEKVSPVPGQTRETKAAYQRQAKQIIARLDREPLPLKNV